MVGAIIGLLLLYLAIGFFVVGPYLDIRHNRFEAPLVVSLMVVWPLLVVKWIVFGLWMLVGHADYAASGPRQAYEFLKKPYI